MIRESDCNDLEAKTVISNLLLEFGSLKRYFEDQRIELKTNYKQKRYSKALSGVPGNSLDYSRRGGIAKRDRHHETEQVKFRVR